MSTLYIITNTVGNNVFSIRPGALNGPGGSVVDSDLRLYGQGSTVYGEGVNENLYRIAESFACPEKAGSPGIPQDESDLGAGNGINNPLTGQPWYNTTTKKLLTYDATSGGFVNPAAPSFGGTAPSAPIEGDLWYDSSDVDPLNHQLKVYEGTSFVSVAERYVRLDGGSTMYGNLELVSNNPRVILQESDAAADNGRWDVVADAEQFAIRTINDADSLSINAVTIARTGTVIDDTSIEQPSSPTTPTAPDDLTRKDYVDDNFVADIGGIMSGKLTNNNEIEVNGTLTVNGIADFSSDITTVSTTQIIMGTMTINAGSGDHTVGGDIEFNSSGLLSADNNIFVNFGGTGAGQFIVGTGSMSTTGDTDLFGIEQNGRINALAPNYETLVTTDSAITNKKYVDDSIATATGVLGVVPEVFTSLSASAKLGDVAIVGGIIYINLAAGNNFKQVWPAIYV